MKAEKLSKSAYRCRKMIKGTVYTVTFDHNPTKHEIEEAFIEECNRTVNVEAKGTFAEGYAKYIESKSNVLSPNTLKGYRCNYEAIPDEFKMMQMHRITQLDIQSLVNELSKKYQPKTVHNIHGLISAILGMFYPSMVISTTLPKKSVNEPYIPTDEEVKRILEYFKGTEWEIGIALACLGLRLSEICAVTIDDLKGNDLYIHKAYMISDGTVRERNKTELSTRHVILPDYLVNLIKQRGEIYSCHYNSLRRALLRAEKELGIQEFTLHTLRHYFASYAHSIGMSDAQIQQMGGWKTDHVMKKVYRRAMNIENAQKLATDHMSKMFN